MDAEGAIITLVAAILSGIVATLITIYINRKSEVKRRKMELVCDILGYRYQFRFQPKDRENLYCALSRIPIIFHDNEMVLYDYNEFIKYIKPSGPNDEVNKSNEIIELLMRHLCEAVDLKYINSETKNMKKFFTWYN